jgi:hypothetical protein
MSDESVGAESSEPAPASPPTCAGCGAIAAGVVAKVQIGDEPPKFFHEVCFLKAQIAHLEGIRQGMTAIVSGILASLGGAVRIHKGEIASGLVQGKGLVSWRQEAGDFTTVWLGAPADEKLVVITGHPDAAPKPPPLKLC